MITLDDADVDWEEGTHLGRTSNVYSFTAEEVNQDIIDHGIVLGYFNLFGEGWYEMPFSFQHSDGTAQEILHT